jgi:hypothetical protein
MLHVRDRGNIDSPDSQVPGGEQEVQAGTDPEEAQGEEVTLPTKDDVQLMFDAACFLSLCAMRLEMALPDIEKAIGLFERYYKAENTEAYHKSISFFNAARNFILINRALINETEAANLIKFTTQGNETVN